MIEILPNWHPVFVHFTVALLSISVLLFVVLRFLPAGPLREQWQIVAQWNLWLGVGFTVCTVLAGMVAYNSVAHDAPSHTAMTEHRNWALVTAAWFLVAAIWSGVRARAGHGANTLLLGFLLLGGGLLASTAWHGGETVYRYGLGVMSLPKTNTHDHAGDHHAHESGGAAKEAMQEPDAEMVDDVNNCELPEKEVAPQAEVKEHEITKSTRTPTHEDAHNHEGHAH